MNSSVFESAWQFAQRRARNLLSRVRSVSSPFFCQIPDDRSGVFAMVFPKRDLGVF